MTKKFISDKTVEEFIAKNNLENLKRTNVVVEAKNLIMDLGTLAFINMRIAMGAPKKNKDLLITAYAKEVYTGGLLQEQEMIINEADPEISNKIEQLLIRLETMLQNKKLFDN